MLNIKVDYSVWNRLKKNFKVAESVEGKLGFFEENRYGSNRDNEQMAQIAKWNEEGTEKIPPRPFMRVGLLEAFKLGYNKDSFQAMATAVANGESPLRILRVSAEPFKDSLRKVMQDWSDPGNAQLTIQLKGFDNPLIETSELMSNVNYKVGKVE